MLALPQDVAARPGVFEKVVEAIGRVGPPRLADIDVDTLLG